MNSRRRFFLGIVFALSVPSSGYSAEGAGLSHEGHSPQPSAPSACVSGSQVESVQVETSELALYEQFFNILQAPVIEQHEHPGRDRLTGYCYRGLSIIVRQDLRQPRPTGWVQINFSVPDAAAVQQELEQYAREYPIAKLEESERNKIIRFRLKPDVKRGDRQAVRLEVFGPEGFMIGFNQYK